MNKPKFIEDVEFKASINTQSGKEWNWINPKHGNFEHPANYYESSLETGHAFPGLNADLECDVVVIGGGLLGASTALHLSEHGIDTILVEKNRIGGAASGRNGGQLTPGLAPLEVNLKELLPTDAPVYDTQFQIDYYRGVSQNRILFGGEGTGSCWSPEKTHQYLLGRIQHVFPQLKQVELDFVWSGTTDLTMNGAADSRKFGHKFPIYAVQGWNGHGVAQTVRIGKAIADDFCGKADDFNMLTTIQHQDMLFGRTLAPVVIPIAKTAYGLGALVNPGKMVSF